MHHSIDNHSDKINIIIHNEHGYVVQCAGCECLQIAFGTFSLDQSIAEFQNFLEVIARILNRKQDAPESPIMKSIVLPTPSPGLSLLFTYNELKILNDMLQTAALILKAETLAS